MITRRRFLRIAVWCGAPIAAGALAWLEPNKSLVRRGYARFLAIVSSPEERLRAHFHYLDLDPAGVEQYFNDYQQHDPTFSRSLPLAAEVYTRYLLSTDFFRHGADESHRISYVCFYDPYVAPCINPFARFAGRA